VEPPGFFIADGGIFTLFVSTPEFTDLSRLSISTGAFISFVGAAGGGAVNIAWGGCGFGLGSLIGLLMDAGGRTLVACGGGGGTIELMKLERPARGLEGGGGGGMAAEAAERIPWDCCCIAAVAS
jgi:hypothetical protein